MIVFDKPDDSPELLAAKLSVRTAYEAVGVAKKQLTTATEHEGRMRFELLLIAHGFKEGGVYAAPGGAVGILLPRADFPYAALRMYKKDGSLSERVLPVYEVEALVPSEAPASPEMVVAADRPRTARVGKLKVLAGNYDGKNEAAVAVTSVAAARKVLGTSAADMEAFFHEVHIDDPLYADVVANPGVVYVRRMTFGATQETFKPKLPRS
jgi:hypothetical protein